MISRRPNRRASIENAPGPRKTIAALMTTANTAGSSASNRFRVAAGNHPSVIPRAPNPIRTPATGVRNPLKSRAPLAIATEPTVPVPRVKLLGSARYSPP